MFNSPNNPSGTIYTEEEYRELGVVLQKYPKPDWAVQWVPHGSNEKKFFPITELHKDWNEFNDFKTSFCKTNDIDFIVFWNNRNIRRKQPADLILAFKTYLSTP